MSKARKSKTDKAQELFYRASLRPSFQQDLILLRKIKGIPDEGIKTFDDLRKWDIGYLSDLSALLDTEVIKVKAKKHIDWWKKIVEFKTNASEILIKNGLPNTSGAYKLLESYVLSNNKKVEGITPRKTENLFISCDVDPARLENPKLKTHGRAMVKIEIYDTASLQEVQDFIQANWKFIGSIFNSVLGKKKQTRIRRMKNKITDELVFELMNKPRSELGLIRGKAYYKDIAVSKILLNKYGIKISPENIRTKFSRQRKLRNLLQIRRG